MGNNIIGCLCRWICKFLTKILKFIICTFSLLLLGIMLFKILLYIDIRHAEIDEMIERFINKENYFKGEVWFSVIATCITAIPGIFCGAFALYQTFRIQKIEQQYHRPSLELYNATMQVWQIDNRNGFKEQISFENYLKAIEKKSNSVALMQISLNFGIKNEIELRSFEIEAIELKIAGEKFCMRVYKKIPKWQQGHRKRFWRDYEKNKIICHVDWDIYPYKLKKVSSKRERELWKSIEMFMNYKGYLDDDYRYPEVVIKAKLGYEYSGDKKEKIECRLSWDGGNNVGEYTCSYGIQMTNNGYFTYDIRK